MYKLGGIDDPVATNTRLRNYYHINIIHTARQTQSTVLWFEWKIQEIASLHKSTMYTLYPNSKTLTYYLKLV